MLATEPWKYKAFELLNFFKLMITATFYFISLPTLNTANYSESYNKSKDPIHIFTYSSITLRQSIWKLFYTLF